ncbi:MAG TPA: hypothetical protein VFH78_13745 [Candidatus Thermoplasmatota archaeon]|nr:hypothetical protein [Candidatus Thermoplasmatota archaeon]
MRLVALALPLLFLLPSAAASHTYDLTYYMQGQGCANNWLYMRNCATFFPPRSESGVSVQLQDISGSSVRIRVCHEWTYDDGSHARVRCNEGCSPSFSDALQHPPWPWNTTYRVIVDLRGGPLPCQATPTAGSIVIAFT